MLRDPEALAIELPGTCFRGVSVPSPIECGLNAAIRSAVEQGVLTSAVESTHWRRLDVLRLRGGLSLPAETGYEKTGGG